MNYDKENAYTFDSRVRFSECDHTLTLTYESLIDYFQDCSMFHAEDAGFGFKRLASEKKAWLVNSWQIIFNKLPKFQDKIRIGTICHEVKGFLGKRNYFMETTEGDFYAYANTFWSYMDMEKMVPTRAPKEMIEAYRVGKCLDMDYADRKIKLPQDITPQNLGIITIVEENIDTNEHVNNAQYIKMALRKLPGSLNIRQIRVEYRDQAHLGDEIIPCLYHSDGEDTYIIYLNNKTDSRVYCVVEVKIYH